MAWNKKIALLFKILIIFMSVAYIATKIYKQLYSTNYHNTNATINPSLWWILIIVVGLTFFNWLTESIKWHYLIKKLQNIPIKTCYKGILSGVTVGIITPNRVGEFGGRILILDRKNRISGVFATLLGGYSQLLITFCAGLIGLSFYITQFPNQIPIKFNNTLVFIVSAVVICLSIFVYFKIEIFSMVAEYFMKQERKKRFLYFLREYDTTELLRILGLSFIRYLIFTSQFYLVLHFFNVHIAYGNAIMGISVIYFLLAITPVISLFEFSIRGSIAVLVLGVFSPLTISIISASVLLWFINIAIPALLGSITLFKQKI